MKRGPSSLLRLGMEGQDGIRDQDKKGGTDVWRRRVAVQVDGLGK